MFEELLTSVGDLTFTNAVFTWRWGAEPVKWVFWTVKSPIDANAVISIQMQNKNISIKLKKRFRNCNKKKLPKQMLRNIVNDFVMHIQDFFFNMHSDVIMHIQGFYEYAFKCHAYPMNNYEYVFRCPRVVCILQYSEYVLLYDFIISESQ